MDVRRSTLEDRDYAQFAWARYRRLMIWMTLAATAAVAIGLIWVRFTVGPVPILIMVFIAGGIFFSVLLAAALMGLVFLSSGSGHDEAIDDPTRDEDA